MISYLKALLKSEKGSALVMVVFLTLVMLLIGGAIMAISFSNVEVSNAYKKTSNLYHVAEAASEKLLDNVNKVIIAEMPRIMKEASDEAKSTVLKKVEASDFGGLKYDDSPDGSETNAYKYNYYLYNSVTDKMNLYEEALTKKTFALINDKFINEPELLKIEYEVKDGRNKIVVTGELERVPDPVAAAAGVGVDDPEYYKKDKLLLKVHASLQNGTDILSELDLEGDVILAGLNEHEEILLEQYEWKKKTDPSGSRESIIPNAFRSPVLTFGDFVVANGAEVVVKGDLRARGYIPSSTIDHPYPELEEYGGVYVSNGSRLKVEGDVVTLANLHTIAPTNSTATTVIDVTGNVIAHSVAVEDDYPGYCDPTSRTWSDFIKDHHILIRGDVYVDNDVAIDRYAEESTITIMGNLFGINNRPGVNNDPNQASGVYCIGNNSLITIGKNAFVHGQAWISFDNGARFSRLYESIGEPYEEVDYLPEYLNGNPIGNSIYLAQRKDYIRKDKIALNTSAYFYAPARISANGYFYVTKSNPADVDTSIGETQINTHGAFDEQEEVLRLFNAGGISESNLMQINPNWSAGIQGAEDLTAVDIISSGGKAFAYLSGDESMNLLKRKYFSDGGSGFYSMGAFRGIEGYMLVRRDIFIKNINTSAVSVNLMDFDKDIVYAETPSGATTEVYNAFNDFTTEEVTWSTDNPVFFVRTAENEEKIINISDFHVEDKEDEPLETIIVDRGNGTIILRADGSLQKLKALIVSNGRVVFDGVSEFEGIIITKGKHEGYSLTTRQLVSGSHAGILVRNNLEITYDPDILFKVKCKNFGVKRVVMDYLGLTNYNAKPDDSEKIFMNATIKTEESQKIQLSPESVFYTSDIEAFKGVRYELETLRMK